MSDNPHDQAAAIARAAIVRHAEIPADHPKLAASHAAEAALIAYSEILCPACAGGGIPTWDASTKLFKHNSLDCLASDLRHILLAWSYQVPSD